MASFNKIILLGNLTRDPALRFTPSGTPVASFGLAVNTPRAGQSGHERGGQGPATERREDVCFVDIVVFGRQAETASEYLRKGRAALIEGRLQWRRWDGQDGQKRSKHEVVAERIQFMPRAREEGPDGPKSGPTDYPISTPTQSRQGMEHTSPRPSRVGEELDVPPLEDDDIPF